MICRSLPKSCEPALLSHLKFPSTRPANVSSLVTVRVFFNSGQSLKIVFVIFPAICNIELSKTGKLFHSTPPAWHFSKMIFLFPPCGFSGDGSLENHSFKSTPPNEPSCCVGLSLDRSFNFNLLAWWEVRILPMAVPQKKQLVCFGTWNPLGTQPKVPKTTRIQCLFFDHLQRLTHHFTICQNWRLLSISSKHQAPLKQISGSIGSIHSNLALCHQKTVHGRS